ncbi:hypothetical protein HZI73_25855 [Vallitalea pronyensis]|uniref:Uncharacterized protein n=1 Tax=Vallitalea pronyensis TaxID=1348613 RepID=A0A8J8MQC5_9FIRM|nr:hypothetical protein [Vallitalea pronyensis]QUI25508.1 hypothetical protein HZI73_25855 [Vallitalea pronyensis]
MNSIKEHFENFTFNMMKPAYEKFHRTDEEYQEACSYLQVNRHIFDRIMKSLAIEDSEFMVDYVEKSCYCASCSNQAMYIEGYRDCIKLLKELEIL